MAKKKDSHQMDLVFPEKPKRGSKKKKLKRGDVRTYTSKAGHKYELRRVE